MRVCTRIVLCLIIFIFIRSCIHNSTAHTRENWRADLYLVSQRCQPIGGYRICASSYFYITPDTWITFSWTTFVQFLALSCDLMLCSSLSIPSNPRLCWSATFLTLQFWPTLSSTRSNTKLLDSLSHRVWSRIGKWRGEASQWQLEKSAIGHMAEFTVFEFYGLIMNINPIFNGRGG